MHRHTVYYSTYPDRLVAPADESGDDGCSILRSSVVTGDVLDVLAVLPDELVRTVVTSPPYWSLRDYSVPGQLGLEDDPDEYVNSLVRVFDEVRRVLTKDGSLWLNIGDSYTSGGRTWRAPDKKNPIRAMETRPPTPKGLKPKELVGIPWRLAFALQASRWYLRSDVIWRKPNAMPESVKDRPTRSHEYLFLFTKSERYHYDRTTVTEANGRNLRTVWDINTRAFPEAHFACVDEDTECLTIEGWKRHHELRPGMLAAQYDVQSELLSWAPIEEVSRYPVTDQQMVAAKNRDVEMLLTPNHRTLIARRHPRTRRWQPLTIIRADELKKSHAIPVAAEWELEGESPLSPDWAELLGWYIAEGCETSHTWTVEIYQSHSANPEKVERIRWLLNCVGAEFTEAWTSRRWRGKDRILAAFQIRGFAAAYLRQWAPGKAFHPSVLRWSGKPLMRLLYGLVEGDGHRRNDGRLSFVQRDKYAADTAQAIGVRLGYSTMVSRRSEGTYIVYFTRKRLISFRGTAGEGADIGTQSYSGVVWCPKLPAGTWVARKKGRSFITGNTFPPELVDRCIKVTSKLGDIVLDPFLGSGTVAAGAIQNQRAFLGIEINPAYVAIARRRISQLGGRLDQWVEEIG